MLALRRFRDTIGPRIFYVIVRRPLFQLESTKPSGGLVAHNLNNPVTRPYRRNPKLNTDRHRLYRVHKPDDVIRHILDRKNTIPLPVRPNHALRFNLVPVRVNTKLKYPLLR
jgi:hypothetical protein